MASLTIKDIARICGVSISTVSRAINDDPGINSATKDRVMQVVKQFNYVPNNSARNLKMTESTTIALMVKGINNPFFQSMFRDFQEGLEEKGYTFLMHTVAENADEGRAAESVAKEKRLKGLIFLGGIMDYPEVVLENINIPFVLCSVAMAADYRKTIPKVSSVSIDDELEAYKTVSYLIQRGHRKIAIITSRRADYTVGYLRLRGYQKALDDNGIDFDPELVGYNHDEIQEYTEANGYAVMNDLLNRDKEFTAVFAISDRLAIGAYKAIYDAGKRIPDDYSVVGFDGIDVGKYLYPALTTVVQPAHQMAESSIDLLMKQINGDQIRKQVTYEAHLLERDSVRDI